MMIKHLEQELIFSLDKKYLPKFREFLRTLKCDEYEAIDCLTAEKGKHTTHNGVFNIETTQGEQLIVVREGEAMHVFLKKNNKFEQLKENFLKFISWINGESGNEEQKKIAKNVKYLFLVGDLVEGIGVYPEQDKDLVILDIYEQYDHLARLLSGVRKDLKIIATGGNHDALRLSEPQPAIDKNLAKALYELENITMLTNPSLVNICSSKNFQGFNVLIYHGNSFPYYAENVNSIRKAGRLDRADLIMKFLLQRRHLAPSHGSTLYVPDNEKDNLVIERIPDFFVSGHIHKTQALNYRGVTMIGCGCWTGQTENQEKRGIVPDPNRVTLVNLQTREVRILNFGEQ